MGNNKYGSAFCTHSESNQPTSKFASMGNPTLLSEPGVGTVAAIQFRFSALA